MVICIAENRRSCEPGVQLLVASLARHSPGLEVALFCPEPSGELLAWLERYPQVRLNPAPLGEWVGYNIKPDALSALLDAGFDDVVWIDSDILVTADVRPIFESLSPQTVVATEEALCSHHLDPEALRARLWGLEVGRVLPFTLNSGVVRLTSEHRPLLSAWKRLLASDDYKAAQAKPWNERPKHMMGDQEVLTALLCSRAFAGLPLKVLRRGREIIQYFGSAGYTLAERWRHVTAGPPAFVHSQGYKPWWRLEGGGEARRSFLNLYQRLSPYVTAARAYRDELGRPQWLEPADPVIRAFDVLGAGRPALVGLPLAAVSDAVRRVRWARTGGVPQ